MKIIPILKNQIQTTKSGTPAYIRKPLGKYNLVQDTVNFGVSSKKRSKGIVTNKPLDIKGNVFYDFIDTNGQSATFEGEKIEIKGKVKTRSLHVKSGGFRAGSVDIKGVTILGGETTKIKGEVKTGSLFVKGDFSAASVDAKSTTLIGKTIIRENAKTKDLHVGENFSVNNLSTNGEKAVFKGDTTEIKGKAETGPLVVEGDFSAGSVDAKDTTFKGKTIIRENANTGSLQVGKNFSVKNLSTNGETAVFDGNTTEIKGKVKTGPLVVEGDFSAASVDAEDTYFNGKTTINKSLKAKGLTTTATSELTVKDIEVVENSSILGSLGTNRIETTGNLELGKIRSLHEIIISPDIKDIKAGIAKKTIKLNSSEIAQKKIKIKLKCIDIINIQVPDKSIFKKLVFYVFNKTKDSWKKLSEKEVEVFIDSFKIKKVIKSII